MWSIHACPEGRRQEELDIAEELQSFGFTTDSMDQLLGCAEWIDVEEGDIFVEQGDTSWDVLAVVQSGNLVVSVNDVVVNRLLGGSDEGCVHVLPVNCQGRRTDTRLLAGCLVILASCRGWQDATRERRLKSSRASRVE